MRHLEKLAYSTRWYFTIRVNGNNLQFWWYRNVHLSAENRHDQTRGFQAKRHDVWSSYYCGFFWFFHCLGFPLEMHWSEIHIYFQQIDAHFWYQNCRFSPLTRIVKYAAQHHPRIPILATKDGYGRGGLTPHPCGRWQNRHWSSYVRLGTLHRTPLASPPIHQRFPMYQNDPNPLYLHLIINTTVMYPILFYHSAD